MTSSVNRFAMITAFLTGATPLIAQDGTTSPSGWEAQWSASVGIDPTLSRPLSESFMAAVAREWSRAGSPIGFRAQLGAGPMPTTRTFLSTECGNCYVLGERRFAELSAAATYTFRRDSRFRPYLLGGPALYGIRTDYSATGATL